MSLTHPVLADAGLRHAFGTREDAPPPGLRRPRQVHGCSVVTAAGCDEGVDADAVVATDGDAVPVGVVTADCVPVLAGTPDGRAVVAIHAGWRGLAAGVIPAGIDALRRAAGDSPLLAAVGPHIGSCCYEVDAPVLDAMRYFDVDLDAATHASRPDHWWLDLGALAEAALLRAGLPDEGIGRFHDACTACDGERFHSYRRDGPRSGRLVHWIAPGKVTAP